MDKGKEYIKKAPLSLITWIDAESDSDWEDSGKVKMWVEEDFIVYEVGWIVAESKKYIVICSQIAKDNDFGNRTKIPKKWILERKDVGILAKRKK